MQIWINIQIEWWRTHQVRELCVLLDARDTQIKLEKSATTAAMVVDAESRYSVRSIESQSITIKLDAELWNINDCVWLDMFDAPLFRAYLFMVERKLRLMEMMAATAAVNAVLHFKCVKTVKSKEIAFPQHCSTYSFRFYLHPSPAHGAIALSLTAARSVATTTCCLRERVSSGVEFLQANVRIYATPKDSTFDLLHRARANTNYSPKSTTQQPPDLKQKRRLIFLWLHRMEHGSNWIQRTQSASETI